MHPTPPHPKLLANSDFFPTNFVPFSTKQNEGNFLFFYVISSNFAIIRKNSPNFRYHKIGKKKLCRILPKISSTTKSTSEN